MLAMWTLIAVVLVGCLSPCHGDQWNVVIHPAVQKVPEYGHVVFTCVSSRPNVVFKWTVPKAGDEKNSTEGEITSERDDLKIVQTANNMSALVIEKALIKRHKRKYRCLAVEPETGIAQPSKKDVFLKITPMSRLHKHFPHLMAIRTADDVLLPAREPNTMDMQCRTLVSDQTRDGLKWTWVKDGYMDLSLNNSGKYQIDPDGRLHVTKLTSTDSGTYMCVASNNRGTKYGSPIRVNVTSSPLEGKCLLQNGDILEVGEKYQLNGDPCNTCTCEEGNRISCRMIRCVPPFCNGRGYTMSNDTCCKYTCNDDAQEMCIDRDGNKVSHGEYYMPEEDPCLDCMCNNGKRGRCRMVSCDTPTCRDFVPSRDVCCDYTCNDVPESLSEPGDLNPRACFDRNGKLVPHGEIYSPDQDPCVQCMCNNGAQHMCMSVSCRPNCTNYTIIPDTCCEYTCDESKEACYDKKGNRHPHGSIFTPGDDACETCKCENGQKTACAAVACYPPPCNDYQIVPGKCCEFVCSNDTWPLQFKSTPKPPNFNMPKSCVDRKGKMINHGEMYNPDVDACVTCMCNNGSQHSCVSASCIPPCEKFTIIPDTCCEFICDENQEVCYDNKGKMHPHGSLYTPGDDPCVTCKCENGYPTACALVSCYPPPCKDFEIIPGKCCEFVCHDEAVVPELNSTKRSCFDSDGTEHQDGDVFTLSEEPCTQCMCENGQTVGCVETVCDAPRCPNYDLIPGTCCGFVCRGQPGPNNIEGEGTKPRITTMPKNMKVVDGMIVSFFCKASGHPPPQLQWLRDGKNLNQKKNRYEVIDMPHGTVLRIEVVKAGRDNATFTCVAQNEHGEASANATLRVYRQEDMPAGYPKIIENPQLKSVEKDHEAVLKCSAKAEGMEAPKIYWLKDSIPVDTGDPRIHQTSDGELTIQRSAEYDHGKYECVAENSVGVAFSFAAFLYVKVRRVPPHFTIYPQSQEVEPNANLSLNCVAVGSPMPIVKWRKGLYDINPEAENPLGRNVLNITGIRQTTNFTCVAQSELGNIEHEVQVKVKVQPDNTPRPSSNYPSNAPGSPPRDVRARPLSSQTVIVEWKEPEITNGGIEGYKVFYTTNPDLPIVLWDNQEVEDAARMTTINNLEPNKTYTISVLAYNSMGTGPLSNFAQVMTRKGGSCFDSDGTEHRDGDVFTLSDEPCTQCMCENGQTVGCVETICDAPPCPEYDLIPGTCCGFVCRGGPGPNNTEDEETPGSMPRDLTPVPIEGNPFSVTLNWQPPQKPNGQIQGYLVFYTTDPNKDDHEWVVEGVIGEILSMTITDLTEDMQYYFKVQARNSKGYSPMSTTVTYRTPSKVPGAPHSIKIETINSTTIYVDWKQPYGSPILRGYYVFLAEVNNNGDVIRGTERVEDTNDGEKTEMIITGLKPDTRYSVSVAGYTRIGDGEQSPEKIINTRGAVPSAPRSLVARLHQQDPPIAQVSWLKPDYTHGDIKGYTLYWGPKGQVYQQVVFKANKQSYITPTLEKGFIYEFRVLALNDIGYGEKAVTDLTTPDDLPATPRNLQAKRLSPTTILVKWDKPTQNNIIARYRVYYCQFGVEDMSLCEHLDTDGSTLVHITGLNVHSLYAIRVQAMSINNAYSNLTDVVTVNSLLKGSCFDSDGTEHRDGDIFTLSEDPCTQCMCENGQTVGCVETVCDAPPCPEYDLIPGTCCGFVCRGGPGPNNIGDERIEGTAFIRQIGSREVLVQWQIPSESSQNTANTTVWLTEGSYHSNVNVLKGRDWAILSNLDPNKVYSVEVKVVTGQRFKTPPVSFMVKDKAKCNLKLNDAIGEVYESRGALDYGSYSLPRMFNRVMLDKTTNVTINVGAFHRVDTTYLEDSPCGQDMCGLIRFYMYSMEGKPINIMSLMFNDNKDFEWAKLHL